MPSLLKARRKASDGFGGNVAGAREKRLFSQDRRFLERTLPACQSPNDCARSFRRLLDERSYRTFLRLLFLDKDDFRSILREVVGETSVGEVRAATERSTPSLLHSEIADAFTTERPGEWAEWRSRDFSDALAFLLLWSIVSCSECGSRGVSF